MSLRAFFLFAALPLLAIAAPDATAPIVVVYPLTATGDVGSAQTGSNIGTAIANKLAQLGGLTVKPFVAGTTRPQYLTAALSENADYYITGYLTPLGSEVSVVEQVVSTRSGSIVFSTTAFARTYADAVGPAEALREAILHHAGRGMASLDAPPPTASPEPIANASGVNISKAFGRRRKASPAPAASTSAQPQGIAGSASPATRAASPAARVALAGTPPALVVSTAGTADVTARTYASRSLSGALRRAGLSNALLSISSTDATAHAAEICKANGAVGYYAGTLDLDGATAGQNVRLDVTAYDCNGNVTGREQASASYGAKRNALNGAIDTAAARIANGFSNARPGTTPATPRATS